SCLLCSLTAPLLIIISKQIKLIKHFLRCLLHQCTSTCRVNHSFVCSCKSFIKELYLHPINNAMMRTFLQQLSTSLPSFIEWLMLSLSKIHYISSKLIHFLGREEFLEKFLS
ncbi:unnamed protein product, partial [Prunus brigantina]